MCKSFIGSAARFIRDESGLPGVLFRSDKKYFCLLSRLAELRPINCQTHCLKWPDGSVFCCCQYNFMELSPIFFFPPHSLAADFPYTQKYMRCSSSVMSWNLLVKVNSEKYRSSTKFSSQSQYEAGASKPKRLSWRQGKPWTLIDWGHERKSLFSDIFFKQKDVGILLALALTQLMLVARWLKL